MTQITLSDLSLKGTDLTERVRNLKDNYFKAMPELCVERPRLVTRLSTVNGLFSQERISTLDKARLYRYVLENRTPVVRHSRAYEKGMKSFEFQDTSLFAGSTTSKFKGVPLYPELLGLALWPELWTISKRASNPCHVSEAEVEELNHKIFPHWLESNITELAR